MRALPKSGQFLIGKEVKRDAGVDLTDTQMLANCLLNCVLIGKYPSAFEPTYQQIVR